MALLQHSLIPSFHSVSLPDASRISDALKLVCNKLFKPESSISPHLIEKLANSSGGNSVGELRKLTDIEWREVELPAICRIYLKYLIRQSQRGTTTPVSTATTAGNTPNPDTGIIQLQTEYNGDKPFDMSLYSTSLSTLTSMGFSRHEALEALLITDNKGPEAALAFIFADPSIRSKKKEDAKQKAATRFNMTSPGSHSSTATSPTVSDRLPLYKEFLRGILIDDRLTRKSYDVIKNEREKRKVSKSEQATILKELGISEDKWEKMRKNRGKSDDSSTSGSGEAEWDMDCVVCLDERKDHLVLHDEKHGGHLCLCAKCANELTKGAKGKAAKCPMCEEEIQRIVRVFM